MAQLKTEYGYTDNPLKKALTAPTSNINSWQDLANSTNQSIVDYAKQGVNPNQQILANGGLNTNDYNGLVKDALVKTGNTPTETPAQTVTPLAQAITTSSQAPQYAQQQYAPSYARATDNSGMINDSYANLASALRGQIDQRKNDKQMEINNLGQTYDPQRATSEVRKSNELRSTLEQSANQGDRGGVGRENALVTQTEGDNRLNAINLQQTNDETSLKNDIANLLLEGNIQEAQLQSQKLKDLIENNKYVDETNYNRSTNADNTAYSRNRDSLGDAINADNTSYSRLRDALGDTRYNNETTYNQGQDSFNNNLKLADILGTYNGQQTMQGRQADVSIAGQQLQNEAQAIQNKFLPQIQQGTIDANSLSNAYQTMVNASYPKEESAKIAQILAQTAGVKLDNAAQAIANKYAPQIALGQIDGQKLQNAYQKLVNNGYSESVAADIASKYANIAQGNAQVAISQQNANTSSAAQAWSQSKDNPDNIYKNAQIEKIQNGLSGTASSMTTKQIGDAKVKVAQQLYNQTGNVPTQAEIDGAFTSLYGTATKSTTNTPTNTKVQDLYTSADSIPASNRQKWYTDNKTEIDKYAGAELAAFKAKYGIK